jgi:hypothetical protein
MLGSEGRVQVHDPRSPGNGTRRHAAACLSSSKAEILLPVERYLGRGFEHKDQIWYREKGYHGED